MFPCYYAVIAFLYRYFDILITAISSCSKLKRSTTSTPSSWKAYFHPYCNTKTQLNKPIYRTRNSLPVFLLNIKYHYGTPFSTLSWSFCHSLPVQISFMAPDIIFTVLMLCDRKVCCIFLGPFHGIYRRLWSRKSSKGMWTSRYGRIGFSGCSLECSQWQKCLKTTFCPSTSSSIACSW